MALRYKGDYEEALLNAELGLKLSPADNWTKFELWDRIGRIYFGDVEDSYPRKNDEGKLKEASVKDLLSVLDSKSSASFATKTFASWQLMDIYFEEFRYPLAKDVEDYLSRKEKSQGSMEQVMKWFSGIQDPDFEVFLSPLSVPLAIMYRDTKQEKKFFEEVDKIFCSCYKALTDNVIYNDKPSYLMLAKSSLY
ncbi:hypothetical protein VE02_04807 [Pseudogymnoascus sp. 03VT05]|nr:hypothetical protein VE02_04807 [Pseudogymnoascus sp. 03VT05]